MIEEQATELLKIINELQTRSVVVKNESVALLDESKKLLLELAEKDRVLKPK